MKGILNNIENSIEEKKMTNKEENKKINDKDKVDIEIRMIKSS